MVNKVLIALLLTGCAAAQRRGWTATDTTLQVAFATEMVIDFAQTVKITEHCHESNPIMGLCGEQVSPYVYFPVTEGIYAVASWFLPKSYRRALEGIGVGDEFITIWRNTSHWQWEAR